MGYVTKELLSAMGVDFDAPLFWCDLIGAKMTENVCLLYRESGGCPGCDRWRCGCDD